MGPNCSYADEQVFGLIIFGYLCGQDRLAHFEQLSRDTTVQHLLFPEKVCEYFCYCTTLAEAPLQLHRLYGGCGESENWIQAVKNQLGAGSTLTH